MVRKQVVLFFLALSSLGAFGQDSEPTTRQWAFDADVNFYFIPSNFFVLPVVRADHKKLHLEARYNYEDRNTFSAWAGYNFEGGEKLQFVITPMASVVFGQTNGAAAGLILELTYKRFELRNEFEYLFDSESASNNFFYNWADLGFVANDWITVGISGQRTKVYQTNLDFQRGMFVTVAKKKVETTLYLYNFGFDEPFLLLTLAAEF